MVPLWLPHTFRNKQVPDEYVRMFYDIEDATPSDREIFGMITNVDRNLGRLMAALKTYGLEEDTLVIFMSDNGPSSRQSDVARFNAGLRGKKGNVYEGGVRVPCYVRWPGRLRPRVENEMTSVIDLLPTFLELAGVDEAVRPLDGISLWPLLAERMNTLPSRFLVQQQQPQRSGTPPRPFMNGAIIGPRYKLVYAQGRETPELFDLLVDEGETLNLAEMQPETAEQMTDVYLTWFDEIYSDRGFASNPPILGNPAQRAFRESMIKVSEAEGIRLVVEKGGSIGSKSCACKESCSPMRAHWA